MRWEVEVVVVFVFLEDKRQVYNLFVQETGVTKQKNLVEVDGMVASSFSFLFGVDTFLSLFHAV